MAPGPDTLPAEPRPDRNQDGRQIRYRRVRGLQHRPELSHLRLPVPGCAREPKHSPHT
jgi:hypothetical protein